MSSRVTDAAMSLVLRTRCLSLGHQIILNPLLRQIARISGDVVTTRENLGSESIPILWELLERLDRIGLFDDVQYAAYKASLRRLEFQVLTIPLRPSTIETGRSFNES